MSKSLSSNKILIFTVDFGIKNEKSLTTGDGLGLAPANPDNPGGVDKPNPTDSFNIIPIALISSCFAAYLSTTSLLFNDLFFLLY